MVLTAPLIDGADDEGAEPRVGVARVPFWAGAQVITPSSHPSFPKTTCDYSWAGRIADLRGLRVVSGFLSRPPIVRQRLSLSVGSFLCGV